MMYPEMMHVIVHEHQKYLRSLASPEPLFPATRSGAERAVRFTRRHLGGAMVRIGILLGGSAPTASFPADL